MESAEEFLYLVLETAISAALLLVAAAIGVDAINYLKLINYYIKNDIKNMIIFIK